jgi:hypothetical protein
VGRRPARTVYEITGEGRLELIVQRDAALDVVFGSADPVSVVLLFAAAGDAANVSGQLAARRRRVTAELAAMTAERGRRWPVGCASAPRSRPAWTARDTWRISSAGRAASTASRSSC